MPRSTLTAALCAAAAATAAATAAAPAPPSAPPHAPPQALYGLQLSGAGSPSLVIVGLDGSTAPVGPTLDFVPGAWDVGAVDDARGTLYVNAAGGREASTRSTRRSSP